MAASMIRESGGGERFQIQRTCSEYPLNDELAEKSLPFLLAKKHGPMVSKELQNVIDIRAMDKTVDIILGLKNDPGCSGHTHKGPNSIQPNFGKFASPSNGLFRVCFLVWTFFDGDTLVYWEIIQISCLSLLMYE